MEEIIKTEITKILKTKPAKKNYLMHQMNRALMKAPSKRGLRLNLKIRNTLI